MAAASAPSGAPPPPARGGPVADRGVAFHDSLRAGAWSTDGIAKVLRDADVESARLRGTVAIGGALRAGRLGIDGRVEVSGGIEVAGEIRGRGDLVGGGTLRAGELHLEGHLRVAGALTVDRALDVLGGVHAAAASAGELRAHGPVVVPGLLRAPAIDLRLKPGSQLGTIEGTTVRVVGPRPNPLEMFLGRGARVSVERIEAQRVELEAVEVAFVHAPEIVLGPDALAVAVEGTILRRHPRSQVGPVSRTPAPPGLWR